jgi:hypothetical protein
MQLQSRSIGWSTASANVGCRFAYNQLWCGPTGSSLDASQISKFGLVLSRFEFNKMPNPAYKPGSYTLQIDGGISAYKAARPAIVAISSAGECVCCPSWWW